MLETIFIHRLFICGPSLASISLLQTVSLLKVTIVIYALKPISY
ncbi:uncharacterized protein DC041_0000375 [Schistosoma bovis]|uniref:Uncharacterized protein n=1 Tax=Schistosoma bovis TaxID=6184 RepID=A0A430PXH2_SCHBO|nr:uncharacterized protein DC041_0000375 [Schistosoma bovis]